jgi:hypothetical protein
MMISTRPREASLGQARRGSADVSSRHKMLQVTGASNNLLFHKYGQVLVASSAAHTCRQCISDGLS